jgi:two-component system, chemotaxis family, response regulator Rcp1
MPKEILVVEDNPGDVRLIREALRDAAVQSRVQVAWDGVEALSVLMRQGKHTDAHRPDLIMLDLNLPKKGGWDVLREIKQDPSLQCIPVAILTSSEAEDDILRSYQLHANCFITKPGNLEQFLKVVKSIDNFWLAVVKLQKNPNDG